MAARDAAWHAWAAPASAWAGVATPASAWPLDLQQQLQVERGNWPFLMSHDWHCIASQLLPIVLCESNFLRTVSSPEGSAR